MGAQHTPGPWHIMRADGEVIVFAHKGPSLAVLLQNPGNLKGSEINDNASLIASAPDLLSALTTIDDMWSECDGEHVNPDEARSPVVREIWHQVRAAIAKAHGA